MLTGASQVVLVVKHPPANAGNMRQEASIPGLGKSPGGGHGHPLQCSCQKNPMNRGVWQATVHRITQICTQLKQLSMLMCTSAHYAPDTLWRSGKRCSPCPHGTLHPEGEADSNQNITQAEEVCISYESYGWWVTVWMTAYSGGFCLIKESGKDSLASSRGSLHFLWELWLMGNGFDDSLQWRILSH